MTSVELRHVGVMLCCLCLAASIAGCAVATPAAPLPTYALIASVDSLKLIAARQSEIKTVSAQCEIELVDARGQQVNLDGALLAMPQAATGPRVRLRAWKLGHAVFDLTVVDGQAWLVAPDDPRLAESGGNSGEAGARVDDSDRARAQPARRIAEAVDFIGPDFFHSARVVLESDASITAEGRADRLDKTTCEIDRATLTPRRFIAMPRAGQRTAENSSECELDDYRLIGQLPWAHRLRLRSPAGIVEVRMSDVEINGDLDAAVFVPPARAKQLP